MKAVFKEIGIFLLVVAVLAVLQHSDLLSDPMNRFSMMADMGNYTHPFLWAVVPYLLLLGLRLAVKMVLKNISSNKED
ncbi:MAG: hypothetical protein ACQERK_07180 [Campylobacterota bacterium]